MRNIILLYLFSYGFIGTAQTYVTGVPLDDRSKSLQTRPFAIYANVGALPSTGCVAGSYAEVTASGLYRNTGTGTCAWTAVGGAVPAGSTGDVQINNAGALGALAVGGGLTTGGATLAVDTSVQCTRLTCSSGVDTYCSASLSGSAYTGAMSGNPLTVNTTGMRVLVIPGTTTPTGAITLDCGSGTGKKVFANDGTSNPTAAQWTGGAQILVSYDGTLNSSAGGWRILTGSSGATVPSVTNLLSGNGSGGISDSAIAPANVPLLNAANVFTADQKVNSGALSCFTTSNMTFAGYCGNSTLGRLDLGALHGARISAAGIGSGIDIVHFGSEDTGANSDPTSRFLGAVAIDGGNTLPTCSIAGKAWLVSVTNALTPAWGATLDQSGSAFATAVCNTVTGLYTVTGK